MKRKTIKDNDKARQVTSLALITMLLISVMTVFVITVPEKVEAAGENWWNADWGYRKLITVNSSNYKNDVYGYPIGIKFTSDSDLYDNANANLSDIRFIDYADNTTEFPYEIENFTHEAVGKINASVWVNVTFLDSTATTNLWIYYNNSVAADEQNLDAVWDSNYVGVWHMCDNESTSISDSSQYDNDGLKGVGDTSAPIQAVSLFGRGQDFTGVYNGAYDHINVSTSDSLNLTDSVGLLIEAVVYNHDVSSTAATIIDKQPEAAAPVWRLYSANVGANSTINLNLGTAMVSNATLMDNFWYYGAGSFNNVTDAVSIFINKTLDFNTTDADGFLDQIPGGVTIGYRPQAANQHEAFDGVMEEIRVSNISRNHTWINLTVDCILDNAGFLFFGAEEESGAAENNAPVQSNENPAHGAVNQTLAFLWNVTVTDADGNLVNVTIICPGGCIQQNYLNHSANISFNATLSDMSYDTNYTVYVNVSDGAGGYDNETYNFSTRSAPDWYTWADGWTMETDYACSTTGYLYGNWSESEHFAGGTLDNEWTYSNSSVWSIEDNSGWWPGNYTFTFDAVNSNHGIAVMNSSGTNRSQEMGWTSISYTGEATDDVYSYVIFAFENASSYDFVMFRALEAYVCHWNGTNITEIDTDYTYTDDFAEWTSLWSEQWDYYYPEDTPGVYWKLIYNTLCGELQFKIWGPHFFQEPAGWLLEYQSDNITYTDCRCHGVGVWNPNTVDSEVYFDVMNLWQLNYSVNGSATMAIPDGTVDRPHMEFPVINLSHWIAYDEYLDDVEEGNVTADIVRDIMLNVTNQLNMESRAYAPWDPETLDQNDTVYYYTALFDNFINYTEMTEPEDASWVADEYLFIHIQMCTDGELDVDGTVPFYDDTIIAIDVDNNGEWDSNDRLFWFGADGLLAQFNGNESVTPVNFNASNTLPENNSIWNMHRYGSHVNHRFLLPLTELVKEDSLPLNTSDVFGLCIITIDDIAADDNVVVWNNWNETACTPYCSEDTGAELLTWFLNYSGIDEDCCFGVNSTTLTYWGEGVITGEGDMSEALSYRWKLNKTANVTTVNSADTSTVNGTFVNYTFNLTNTGTGTIADIHVNESWFNCSCADWKFTLVETDLPTDAANWTIYNDSCYLSINLSDLPGGNTHAWYIVVNITECNANASGTIRNYCNVTGNLVTPVSDYHDISWDYTASADEDVPLVVQHPPGGPPGVGHDDEEEEGPIGIPGFELIALLGAIGICLILIKKKEK